MANPNESKRTSARARTNEYLWLLAHMMKSPHWVILFIAGTAGSILLLNESSLVLGGLLDGLKEDSGMEAFRNASLLFMLCLLGGGLAQWLSSLTILHLRLRVEKAVRGEIYHG